MGSSTNVCRSLRRAACGLGVVVMLSVLAVRPARATLMVELSLEELAAGCDGAIHGVVDRTGTQMAVSGSAEPFTLARIDVVEWLVGAGGPRVTLREPGAFWRTGGVRVDGTPSYRVGEEVVVFLQRDVNGFYRTYAMAQGKFTVRRAPDVVSTVERDLRAAAFLRWERREPVFEAGRRGTLASFEVFAGYLRQLRELRP